MKSGAINIDKYAGGEPAEQFDFLYENFSIMQELLKDYREELIRKVTCYHRVNTDLEIFTSKLGTMCLKDQNIIRPYLLREKSMDDLAVDLGIDYRSAVKHVYRIKKRLIEKVEPKLTVMNRRGA